MPVENNSKSVLILEIFIEKPSNLEWILMAALDISSDFIFISSRIVWISLIFFNSYLFLSFYIVLLLS